MNKKYRGIIVPAITPLTADRTLDTGAAERLLTSFPHPFILGTTGEAPSLPAELKKQYIRLAGKVKKTGQQLYVGISSNCPDESVEWARFAFGEGADVVVSNLPSYYPLTDDLIRRHFEWLIARVNGPLVIYNIPSTTHHSIPLAIIDELSHHPNVVATKDSERNEERLHASLKLWAGREDFSHFLGWAARSGEALLNGCDGLVPSNGNLDAGVYVDLEKAAAKGDKTEVQRLQAISDQLGASYQSGRSLGESLAALKSLMHQRGLCQPYMMPPL
ncbi:MAG TPA: dihydrodipicolinate synthase family protein [Puia sp.]|jgi:4-hydroxy-tetrahydrodipicolinate synthase|nr:dihydrodipicolinate synthase family protein [Puia sp.]